MKFFSLFHNDAQFFSLSYDLSIVWLHSNGLTYLVPLFTDQNKLNRLLLLIGCLMKGIEAKFLHCDPPFPLWNGWLTLTRFLSYFINFLIFHFLFRIICRYFLSDRYKFFLFLLSLRRAKPSQLLLAEQKKVQLSVTLKKRKKKVKKRASGFFFHIYFFSSARPSSVQCWIRVMRAAPAAAAF